MLSRLKESDARIGALNDVLKAAALDDPVSTIKHLLLARAALNDADCIRVIDFIAQQHPSELVSVMQLILSRHCSAEVITHAMDRGMAPDIQIPTEKPDPSSSSPSPSQSLPLPLYLAHTRRLPLLLHLLNTNTITFTATNVTSEALWPHIHVSQAEIPILCAVMEHFGKGFRGESCYNLVQWVDANRMLSGALTEELTKHTKVVADATGGDGAGADGAGAGVVVVGGGGGGGDGGPGAGTAAAAGGAAAASTAQKAKHFSYFARTLVEVTPIHTQAVAIAAKCGFAGWISREAQRLSTLRPEGYTSWIECIKHLQGQQELATRVLKALEALKTDAVGDLKNQVTELVGRHESVVIDLNKQVSRLEDGTEQLKIKHDHEISELKSELDSTKKALTAQEQLSQAVRERDVQLAEEALDAAKQWWVRFKYDDAISALRRAAALLTPYSLCSRLEEWGKGRCEQLLCTGYVGTGYFARDSKTDIFMIRVVSRDSGEADLDDISMAIFHGMGLLPNRESVLHLLEGCMRSSTTVSTKCLREYNKHYDCVFLHRAAIEGRKPLVKFLLSQGFDANAKNIHGETALHRVKDVTIAKCLIEHGADVHVKDNACQTPLFVAHHVGMIDYLIECGAEINGGRCPLYFVRSLAVLKCMLRHGADVVALRSDISTWLRYIGLSLSSLLDNGVDVNVRDKDNQSTLLHHVSDADDARVLLERGASVHARDKMGRTPLHTQQSYEVQKLLLEAKADVNARDDKGATLLHSTPNAELLLQHGADIHARDKHGRSALHVRVRSPYDAYPECPASRVDTLIGHGADVHARDAEGKTPLHDANESVVSCLLSHGADINSQDDKGCTRLHTLLRSSTYSWNRHVISDMLKHKADIHIVNNDGMTPLDIAHSRNDQEIVERMLSMQK